MSAQGVHKITAEFESELCRYTSAPFAVAVDNASSAIFLALCYENIRGQEITIPERTYMSAACEVINAGGAIKFESVQGVTLRGAYQFKPTRAWDSALLFSADMYLPDTLMCVSFTGAYKNLKLSKGGAILLDDGAAYEWLKKARNSGRGERPYMDDSFEMIGKNSYLMPEIAARGLLLMQQFYHLNGSKIVNDPIELPYPKLSEFDVYSRPSIEQREIALLRKIIEVGIGFQKEEVKKLVQELNALKTKRLFE